MFRFAIRDLLWLTVVVALGVAWWVDRERLATSLSNRRQEMESDEEWYFSQLNRFARGNALLRKLLREQAAAEPLPSD